MFCDLDSFFMILRIYKALSELSIVIFSASP